MKKLHVTAVAAVGATLLVAAIYYGAPSKAAAGDEQPRAEVPLLPYRAPAYAIPSHFGVHRIFLDAGHGAADNRGNLSSLCQQEQEFTLALAEDLAQRLTATGHFEVQLSRAAGELVPYPERAATAADWDAEVLLSLHSDVRGKLAKWSPEPGVSCPRSRRAPGFSVLWSDEAPQPLRERRLALARSVAAQLQLMGSLAYDGAGYRDQYEADQGQPGVFVDRRDKRIFMLRSPSMPSIIIETHNAVDDREARRWNREETREAFAAAIIAALVDALGG